MDAFNDYLSRYYPLLTLGGVSSRASQYRDAERGVRYEDRIPSRELFGRALNDQLDAFQQSIPQYLQYQRQLALDKEKLAYDREQRKYQQQLNPMLLKQQELANKLNEQKLGVYDGYYQQIESAPIPEAQKEYFRGLTPQQGLKPFQTLMQTVLTRKPPAKFETLPANHPDNPTNVPIQRNVTTGELKTPISSSDMEKWNPADPNNPKVAQLAELMNVEASELLPLLRQNQRGELDFEKTFDGPIQQRFMDRNQLSATAKLVQKFPDPSKIISFADLASIGANTLPEQEEIALNVLNPQNLGYVHHLYDQAKNKHNRKFVISGQKGFVKLEGAIEDYQSGKKPVTAEAPMSYNVMPGDEAQDIVDRFKAQGKEVKLSQLIASNPDFFTAQDPNKMKTSAQVGRPMTIPVGGPELNNNQVLKAQRSFGASGGQGIQVENLGTIYPVHVLPSSEIFNLNRERDDMQSLIDNIDQLLSLYERDDIGLLDLGEYSGAMDAIGWRIVNNIQRLRDYGVITQGELVNLRKSVPDPREFGALIRKDIGGKQFIKGVFNALRQEAERKQKQATLYLRQTASPIYSQGYDLRVKEYRPFGDSGGGTNNEAEGGSW
tara:strand:- start:2663 stop:4480 length:1818 start_codon:yes stop_codon:yes gene_type:complete